MRLTSESKSNSVVERQFELEVAGDRVPGVVWSPAGATGPRPLVLMGHGGSQHKRADSLVQRARWYVGSFGYAVAAIDAPDHGDRTTPERAAEQTALIQGRIAAGRGLGRDALLVMADRAARAVPEWRATLDALQTLEFVGTTERVGYWGVSMGTIIGVPLVATEPRICAAVFGLAGVARTNEAFRAAAAAVTVPIEFVFQWDDELVSREAGLELFNAFGSTEKTLHANPGGHLGIPAFEGTSWERFFTRHLS
jgi:dienelactone hydrolase